ncbi:MAG: type II toxin-antitoxin system PemK/MazF family toxin [Candidatus Bathyarchaeota archaeon]|nr:type II toxin-antitoxin system PemK/MazF family toxin [Candidatus Bathyarchaeota archaeon]
MNPNPAVGEIWLVDLDDVQGHEQHGTRPGLVLAIHSQANLVMVTPFTGNLDAQRFPYAHKVTQSATNGLTRDSVALVYQTRCLTDERFIRKIGDMETEDLEIVKLLLKTYCDL